VSSFTGQQGRKKKSAQWELSSDIASFNAYVKFSKYFGRDELPRASTTGIGEAVITCTSSSIGSYNCYTNELVDRLVKL